ncbi:GDSL esterase/lipase At4g30140-like isoform X2 [Quercus robur]|uniref:GDSL esterase/lipase At4g30140-like isoform X2 n=1 Tax=Quercus robur TaxID=38942 RepID=UPI002161CFB8|nr:GDSL esterase/lipase At4g30140-like isoform X2 [Quercus robur]
MFNLQEKDICPFCPISIKVLYSFWFSMACQMKKKLLLLLLVLLVSNLQPCVNGTQQVPCFFIFGDLLSDNGNNNNLVTKAKANYQPYGIDFPGGPTGRFTNGRNLVDIIAEHLGFNNSIPPFATASGQEILKGVNYASGGAGIREETGQQPILHNLGALKVVGSIRVYSS